MNLQGIFNKTKERVESLFQKEVVKPHLPNDKKILYQIGNSKNGLSALYEALNHEEDKIWQFVAKNNISDEFNAVYQKTIEAGDRDFINDYIESHSGNTKNAIQVQEVFAREADHMDSLFRQAAMKEVLTQEGNLNFIMSQDGLREQYLRDISKVGGVPTDKNATEWMMLQRFEKTNDLLSDEIRNYIRHYSSQPSITEKQIEAVVRNPVLKEDNAFLDLAMYGSLDSDFLETQYAKVNNITLNVDSPSLKVTPLHWLHANISKAGFLDHLEEAKFSLQIDQRQGKVNPEHQKDVTKFQAGHDKYADFLNKHFPDNNPLKNIWQSGIQKPASHQMQM